MSIAKANHIEIWYETFGNPEDESLLLIMGGCCQGILWPTEFCEQLVKAGFFVIRFDHRDTGLSSCFNYKKNPYNLNNMMMDTIGLMDFLKIDKFHALGLSLGAPIAELLAIHYPTRTRSITLIAATYDFRPMNLAYAGLPPEKNSLPRTKDIYLEWMKKFLSSPPKDQDEHIELRLEGWRLLTGDKVPFEDILYRKLHKEFLERNRHLENIFNHIEVCRVSEEIVKSIPHQVKVPTLILQGSEDVIIPPPHGKALAALIKHSKYVLLEGMGHVLNYIFYKPIIDGIKKLQV